ncbi:DNA methyltransferase [Pelagibacterium lentulum]|nr:DNA methyltransferase [Pelagibacterium lentulum]
MQLETMNEVWTIDDRLEPTEFVGFAEDRFPLELAVRVLETFSSPGDTVLDPFVGLGTTFAAGSQTGRKVIGIEVNPERVAHLHRTFAPPHMVIASRVQDVEVASLPPVSLLYCSPPYPTVHLRDDPWGSTYFEDMRDIFQRLATRVRPDGHMVIEVSNVRTKDGFRPLVAQFTQLLGEVFIQTAEIIRTHNSDWPAGPGVNWSAMLVFTPNPPKTHRHE